MVKNLKPANLRGVDSKGMILAASKGNELKVLEAPKSRPGSKVFAEGIESRPEKEIDIELFSKVKLTTKQGKVVYEDFTLRTEHEDVICNISDNAEIR